MRSTVVTEQDVQRDIRLILKDEARPRSLPVAYALWLFLFWLGAHRFYLGRPRSGVMMLACSVVTLGIGGLIWACVDAFLIPGMVAERNVRFIEPRWMRVRPLDDLALDEVEPQRNAPAPTAVARFPMVHPPNELDELPVGRASRAPASEVDGHGDDEPRFVYHSGLPFMRRPAQRTTPLTTA